MKSFLPSFAALLSVTATVGCGAVDTSGTQPASGGGDGGGDDGGRGTIADAGGEASEKDGGGVDASGADTSMPPPHSLPPNVSLTAIDGEHMLTPTEQSHDYWKSNGYVGMSGGIPGLPNFDDPSIFPVGTFYGCYCLYQNDLTGTSKIGPPYAAPSVFDLGLNISFAVTGNSDTSLMLANGMPGIPGLGQDGVPEVPWAPDIAGMWIDEQDPTMNIANVTDSNMSGRAVFLGGTYNQIVFDSIGSQTLQDILAGKALYTDASGTKVKVAAWSADLYWMSGSVNPTIAQWGFVVSYNPPTWWGWGPTVVPLTGDQMSRAKNYGNMISVWRKKSNGCTAGQMDDPTTCNAPAAIPFTFDPENTNGYLSDPNRNITPQEMQWVVWSGLIHGARLINYFTDYQQFDNTTPVGGITVYAQAKKTNTLVQSLARVLSSPNALNYVTVSPRAYVHPVYRQSEWFMDGVEVMAKYVDNGPEAGTFYLISTYGGSEAATNVPATFTVADTAATSVTVVGENRTIPVTKGTFTDTFANGWTVHVYKVNG